jgi:rhodanese-related sulfurtransferase
MMRIMIKHLLAFLFPWSVALASGPILPVSPSEGLELKNAGKAIIIDVREQDEISAGMVKDAKWLPLSKLPGGTEGLDKSKEMLLYCRSGMRSAKAGAILVEQGFRARNLGAYSKLVDAGYPTWVPQGPESMPRD